MSSSSVDPNEILPVVKFTGNSPRDIGHQHGLLLKDRIHLTIDFYKKHFLTYKSYSEQFLFSKCEHYRSIISQYNASYIDELDAISISSNVHPLWIIALNIRSEIINHLLLETNECTALYSKTDRLLGQNWDWAEEFEHLAFINYLNSDILQLTEPGVLGKIGFNSSGIGVCLNFVQPVTVVNDSIPLHILLRSILDSSITIQNAVEILKLNGTGCGGNILIGDDKGNCVDVELTGNSVNVIDNQMLHTNHFLSTENNHISDGNRLNNSLTRFKRAQYLLDKNTPMKSILLDCDEEEAYPILRPYKKEFIGNAGTCTSLIMKLDERKLFITKGNPLKNNHYYEYQL